MLSYEFYYINPSNDVQALINIFNNIRNSEEGLYRKRLILLNKLVKYIRLFISHLITEIILILARYINNISLNILEINYVYLLHFFVIFRRFDNFL